MWLTQGGVDSDRGVLAGRRTGCVFGVSIRISSPTSCLLSLVLINFVRPSV